jgi:hypothetical protein
MKNFAAILSALLIIGMLPFSASAQIKMSAGLKGGLSMANLSNVKTMMELPPGVDVSARYGFTGYGFFGVQFIGLIGAQVEVGYAMKGTKIKGTVTGIDNGVPVSGDVEATMSVDYLEIPVLAKLCLPMPIINPYIYAGPSIGVLLSAKYHHRVAATGGGQSGTEDTTMDVKDNVKSTDVGLAFGAGMSLPMGLLVDLRYTLGLSTIVKEETGSTTPNVKNGVFAIMVGWGLKL